MAEIIGRAVSRKKALRILRETRSVVPPDRVPDYDAALSRVTYEFKRHDPVKPKGFADLLVCGYCSMMVRPIDNYCPNCGREIKRDDDDQNTTT